MFVLCFCYSSFMFLLLFYYAFVILPLKRNFNTTLFFILRYLYVPADDYVTKELLIEFIICSNKHQRIEKVTQGVSIRTCIRSVQESGYVLGNIETKTSPTPRENSRYVLKTRLAALDMRLHPKNADTEEILDDIPRGELNRNPTEKRYSIPCPSFGLVKCTKTFCVSKKRWYLLSLNIDVTSKQISVRWSDHFKGQCDTNKIPHLVLKMVYNNLCNLYSHHILKHGGNNYPYFDYDENNRRSERIKADASLSKWSHGRQLTGINSNNKVRIDTVNKAEPDMSVRRVKF